MKKPKPKKERIWLYVDREILEWVYEKMRQKVYADESHCFERLITEKIQEENKKRGN